MFPVTCAICIERFEQSNNILSTLCGHIFHRSCLVQWFETSETCPQCRKKLTQSATHPVFFSFGGNQCDESNSSSLKERIDNLKFQILLKEKDITYYSSKVMTLKKQNVGLRKETRSIESELGQHKSAIHALKEQVKYFKGQSAECDKLKQKVAQLTKKLEEVKHIQKLLHSPDGDIEEMLEGKKDPNTLMLYISVIKQDLLKIVDKCKQLRFEMRELQEEKAKLLMDLEVCQERQANKLRLEKIKNVSLQDRVNELEEMLAIRESKKIMEENNDSEPARSKHRKSPINDISNTKNKRSQHLANGKEAKLDKTTMPKKTVDATNNSSVLEVENSSIRSLDENSSADRLLDDSPTVPKRSRLSMDWKENDLSNISVNSETEDKLLEKLKKKSRNTGGKEKRKESQKKSRAASNSSVIDLT